MARIENSMALAQMIDHTLLSPLSLEAEIAKLCAEARRWNFRSVCVNPRWVYYASAILRGSTVGVCSVISFPFGADSPTAKVAAARQAIMDGASEIDMVADLSAIKNGDLKRLSYEMAEVMAVCRCFTPAAVLKVIIESAALDEVDKIMACRTCAKVGVDFIKTSTGFHKAGGATVEDVRLMKREGGGLLVKASGGIRTAKDAIAMVEAGADRLGCSASVAIIQEFMATVETVS